MLAAATEGNSNQDLGQSSNIVPSIKKKRKGSTFSTAVVVAAFLSFTKGRLNYTSK
jgi:hypothetical protein